VGPHSLINLVLHLPVLTGDCLALLLALTLAEYLALGPGEAARELPQQLADAESGLLATLLARYLDQLLGPCLQLGGVLLELAHLGLQLTHLLPGGQVGGLLLVPGLQAPF